VKITRIRLERRTLPLDPPFLAAWDPNPRTSFEATLVFVETDEGLTGIGSGDTMDAFERYEHLFLGEDPLAIERHVEVLQTIAFHAARYWPLEAALWDLRGKAEGKPVADFFSPGARRLPVYASTGELRAPEQRAEDALALREEGFRALKVRVSPDRLVEGLDTVARVRDAVGDSMEIMVDLNQGWRMPGDVRPFLDPDAVEGPVAALVALGVFWVEEPMSTTLPKRLAGLRAETGARLAGGEMVRAAGELDACLAAEALDVYQPDAVLAIGLWRGAQLALRVFAHGHSFSPHTWTNGIGLLANLHLTAGVGGGPYLEFPYDPPTWTPERRDFMLAEPLRLDDGGCLAVPEKPGLGIELADAAD
jgi:D-galactarolactone cycloisomerase